MSLKLETQGNIALVLFCFVIPCIVSGLFYLVVIAPISHQQWLKEPLIKTDKNVYKNHPTYPSPLDGV
mgnify:CR=1 FL=1